MLTLTHPGLCIVVHDVAPGTWAHCRRVIEAIDAIGELPLTLLAVPRYHHEPRDADFERWLQQRASRGDEICLHGDVHLDEGRPRDPIDRLRRRFYTRGEGEFVDLDQAEATRRIRSGLMWLHELGLRPQGFVAPAWLMSEGTWQALCELPISYTCTLRSLWLMPQRYPLAGRAQVFSSQTAWRRVASIAWNRWLAGRQRHAPVVRLELHPHDADDDAVRRTWQALLRRHLRTRTPMTLAELTTRWRRAFERLAHEADRDRRLEEAEHHQLRRDGADGRADRDVAQVMQSEHDPR